MQPERDDAAETPGEAPPEQGKDARVTSEQQPAGDSGGALPVESTPAAAAGQRSTERLILAEVACMIITAAGVFLGFVPLVIVGFALSVVAVVAV